MILCVDCLEQFRLIQSVVLCKYCINISEYFQREEKKQELHFDHYQHNQLSVSQCTSSNKNAYLLFVHNAENNA